jgi:threonine/homoserine/homoserine lactone efflux protein
MLGGSVWNAICIVALFIGVLLRRSDVAALAIILFGVGYLLRWFVIKEDKNGK